MSERGDLLSFFIDVELNAMWEVVVFDFILRMGIFGLVEHELDVLFEILNKLLGTSFSRWFLGRILNDNILFGQVH